MDPQQNPIKPDGQNQIHSDVNKVNEQKTSNAPQDTVGESYDLQMDQLQVLEANKAKSTLGGVSASPGTSNRYPPQQANNTSQDATLGTNFKDQKPRAEDQIALVDKAQQQDAEKFFLTGVNVNTKGVGQNETSDKYEVHDVL